jgi:hypothetical protein
VSLTLAEEKYITVDNLGIMCSRSCRLIEVDCGEKKSFVCLNLKRVLLYYE